MKQELRQIPGCTSGDDSDDTIEINVREIPGHIAHGHTMEAAEILATLAAGGDPDWLPDFPVPRCAILGYGADRSVSYPG